MAGRGFDKIVLRIPKVWDAEWYRIHFRDVLSKGDARNQIEGGGVTVTGNTDEPATLAADANIAAIAAAQFVTLALTGALANERKLTTSSQITVVDGGAGGNVTLTLALGAIVPNNFADFPALSALVRRNDSDGVPNPVAASSDGQVLRRGLSGGGDAVVEFGAVDLASANAVTGVLPEVNIDVAIARSADVATAIAAATAPVVTTVGALPASATNAPRYFVTDALTPAFLAPVAGGGAVYTPVFWNGTAWIVG